MRYVEDMCDVQVTAEGELPLTVVEQLRTDVVEKLQVLEQAPITCRMIDPA